MKSLGTINVAGQRNVLTLAQNTQTGVMRWYTGSFQVEATPAFKTIDKALAYAEKSGWIHDGSEFNERRTPATY